MIYRLFTFPPEHQLAVLDELAAGGFRVWCGFLHSTGSRSQGVCERSCCAGMKSASSSTCAMTVRGRRRGSSNATMIATRWAGSKRTSRSSATTRHCSATTSVRSCPRHAVCPAPADTRWPDRRRLLPHDRHRRVLPSPGIQLHPCSGPLPCRYRCVGDRSLRNTLCHAIRSERVDCAHLRLIIRRGQLRVVVPVRRSSVDTGGTHRRPVTAGHRLRHTACDAALA